MPGVRNPEPDARVGGTVAETSSPASGPVRRSVPPRTPGACAARTSRWRRPRPVRAAISPTGSPAGRRRARIAPVPRSRVTTSPASLPTRIASRTRTGWAWTSSARVSVAHRRAPCSNPSRVTAPAGPRTKSVATVDQRHQHRAGTERGPGRRQRGDPSDQRERPDLAVVGGRRRAPTATTAVAITGDSPSAGSGCSQRTAPVDGVDEAQRVPSASSLPDGRDRAGVVVDRGRPRGSDPGTGPTSAACPWRLSSPTSPPSSVDTIATGRRARRVRPARPGPASRASRSCHRTSRSPGRARRTPEAVASRTVSSRSAPSGCTPVSGTSQTAGPGGERHRGHPAVADDDAGGSIVGQHRRGPARERPRPHGGHDGRVVTRALGSRRRGGPPGTVALGAPPGRTATSVTTASAAASATRIRRRSRRRRPRPRPGAGAEPAGESQPRGRGPGVLPERHRDPPASATASVACPASRPAAPAVCSARLTSTGSTAPRTPVTTSTHGRGRSSSASRAVSSAAGSRDDGAVVGHPARVDGDRTGAGQADVVRGDDDVVGAADRREVDLLGQRRRPEAADQRRPLGELPDGGPGGRRERAGAGSVDPVEHRPSGRRRPDAPGPRSPRARPARATTA